MTKSLRWLMASTMALALASPTLGAAISVNEARGIASEFMTSRGGSGIVLSETPVYTAGNASNPLYYVFNSADGGAFVIVSADDTTVPVLGFSFESSYSVQNVPGAMSWVMEGIQRELKAAPGLQQSLSETQRRNMARQSSVNSIKKELVTANWSQEAPFNNMIPGKPLVGCVGTAMATIMKYHAWPPAGTGSFGGVDFSMPYSWDSMRTDNYRSGYTSEEGEAVATLMYHSSKSIDTQYAMSGSSAYEVRVPWALSTYFGYDPGVSYKKRAEVSTQQEWDNIVKAEIDAGRPVLYCGQDVTAGHAFVCDGYDGDYLHFNWGWGGSANGYFLSTALNPTVSRTHHYNNLNTIIYNIQPASGEITNWSPLHITADGNQPGIGSNLTMLADGKSFKVRVGNLKNLSYDNFAGKVAVALCATNGSVRTLLSNEQSLSLISMQVLNNGYIEFGNCKLPSGAAVVDGDAIRIVTKANGSDQWLPVAGELLTINQLEPETTPATFNITSNAVEGAIMEGALNVIRGWDYTFKAILDNPDTDVLTVKANGYVLTGSADNTYTIKNVREDQQITLIVQKAADVKEKRSFWVGTPGTLSSLIKEEESGTIKDLTLFGTIDANDFAFMKGNMRLSRLDISGVTIAANGSNQANAIPREAFRGCSALKEVVLPNSVNRLNNGCFRQCGITKITIPANVKTYEYNIFVSATALRDIYVGRETAEFINWCVLSGVKTNLVTLHCPSERAVNNYKNAENWKSIANIIVDPIPATTDATFAVQEDNNVNFECATTPGKVDKGTKVNFTANYVTENDNRMQVYANSTLLTPDANGVYSTTINGNTIIHFDEITPIAVDNNKSAWKLTAANGSVGMLTDAVNVIPGQEFTVRLNAVEIPQGWEQFYWAMALTDANGNIKEFISTPVVWSAGAGKNFKLNVTCKVNDSNVREGNQIRLVTSAMKKTWNLVEAEGEDVVAALPAVNNMTPVYNITIPEVEGVNISGAVASAVRGRDITIKLAAKNPSHRLNVKENGKDIAAGVAALNHTFIAMEDKTFEIECYDPKADGTVVYNVAPGTLHVQMTEANVAAHVVVIGDLYSTDIQHATGKDFAINTIKTLDLRGANIVQQGSNAANQLLHPFFVYTNGMTTPPAIVEQILLPDNVTRIIGSVFKNCPNIQELTLPRDLLSVPAVRTTASGGKVYDYGLGYGAFDKCDNLKTIYIPGTPQEYNGVKKVAHSTPSYFNLGSITPSKVTVVVPEEYFSLYRAADNDNIYGNPWKKHGFNILSENPVYGLSFDPTRVIADEDLDLGKTASFLGNDVTIESKTIEGKLRLANPDVTCKILDNGNEVTPAEDGTIPVTFYNPAKKPELAGNHTIEVIFMNNLAFNTQSTHFTIKDVEVSNENDVHTESLDIEDEHPVLKNVAENSTVKFGVDFNSEHSEGMEMRVMLGQEELLADEEGIYSVAITNGNREVTIYAVPGEGATLSAEDLESINPDEAAAISSIAFEGDMTPEQLSEALEMFSGLEHLDLSNLNGELPENAFAGMENLTSISLPEVETISAGLFDGCTSLETVEIPESVNIIGADAFKGCESLSTIRLTGITDLGDGAFDGCTSLTSVTFLANETTGHGEGKPRRTNIGVNAFKGINPNCIIVLDEGVSQPSATANYLITTSEVISETQPDGSVIERNGRVYSAGGDISFKAGLPVAIPHAFTVAEGQTVTLDADLNKASVLVVPFNVESIETTGDQEVVLTLPTARVADKYNFHVYTAEETSDDLQPKATIEANVPYVTSIAKDGAYVFRMGEGKVPSTPTDVSVAAKDYTLHASYTSRSLPEVETYLLNNEGSAFDRAGNDEEGTVTVDPFTVYATTQSGANYIPTGINDENITTLIEEVIQIGDLGVSKEGMHLVITSPDSRELKLYAVDGRLVRVLKLEPGRNVTELPERGVYVIGKTRIMF